MAFGQINDNTTIAGDAWRNQVGTMSAQCGTAAAPETDLTAEVAKLLGSVAALLKSVASFSDQVNSTPPQCGQPAPVQPPQPSNSCHPSGSLKSENGVITTPGGYKVEPTNQYEWKITGPDGQSTRVWGDPHVDESDGGKWDFKRDSTFVLGDGTRINVTTAPYNNMTITKGLEIISGNDRVLVSDIDKGKGKIGDITQDGFANVNSFGGKDVFVMGQNAADWSFQGKEIIGSNNGGDTFKLGNALAPLVSQTNKFGGGFMWATKLFNALSNLLNSVASATESKTPARNCWDPRAANKKSNQELGDMLNAVGGIFASLAKIINFSSQISMGRFNQNLN